MRSTKEELTELLTRQGRLQKLFRQANTGAGKANIEGLRVAVQRIREGYISIPITRHSNVVVALFAEHQGKEHALTDRLSEWESVENRLSELDKEIEICKERLDKEEKSVVFKKRGD